jgi:hypothetical protein
MSKKLKKLQDRLEAEWAVEMDAWNDLFKAMKKAGIDKEWAREALLNFEFAVIETNKTRRKIRKHGGMVEDES